VPWLKQSSLAVDWLLRPTSGFVKPNRIQRKLIQQQARIQACLQSRVSSKSQEREFQSGQLNQNQLQKLKGKNKNELQQFSC
jgi:hypothetical protein